MSLLPIVWARFIRRGLWILDLKSNLSLDLPCVFARTYLLFAGITVTSSSVYSFFYAHIVVPVCLNRYISTSCSGVHSFLEYRAGCRARPLGLYKKSPENEKSRVGESDQRINLVVFWPAGQSSSVVLARDTYIGISYDRRRPQYYPLLYSSEETSISSHE